MASYSAPYRGGGSVLPPGFMEAATAPGRAIGQGIASAGASLAGGLVAGMEEAKKLKAQAKMAEGFLSTLKPEERPISLEEFANFSSREKVDRMQGILGAQSYRKGQEDLLSAVQQRKNSVAQAELIPLNRKVMESQLLSQKAAQTRYAQEEEARKKRDAAVLSFNQEMARRSQAPQPGEQGPPVDQSQDLLHTLASSNLLMDDQTDNMLSALGRMSQMEDAAGSRRVDATPQAIDVGGNPFVYSKKTGMMLPNPKQGAGEAVPLYDPDTGAHLGHALRNPKSGAFTMIPLKRQGTKDMAEYEKIIGELDGQIGYQQKLKTKKDPSFNPATFESLTARRRRVMSEYSKAFPWGSDPDTSAPPAGGAAPAATPQSGGANPQWRGGKLVFPK